jgi:hypothetical protein
MEVVLPLDGDAVTLRPCPPWCAEERHFADDEVIYADDGYHHHGTEIEVPTSSKFLGMADGPGPSPRPCLTSRPQPNGTGHGKRAESRRSMPGGRTSQLQLTARPAVSH